MANRADLGRARFIEDAAINAAQHVATGRVDLDGGAQRGMAATYANSFLPGGGIGRATRRAASASWDEWRVDVDAEMRRHLAEWPVWLARFVELEAKREPSIAPVAAAVRVAHSRRAA